MTKVFLLGIICGGCLAILVRLILEYSEFKRLYKTLKEHDERD